MYSMECKFNGNKIIWFVYIVQTEHFDRFNFTEESATTLIVARLAFLDTSLWNLILRFCH